MLKFIAKLLISAALLALMLRSIDLGAVGAVLRTTRVEYLAAAVVMMWVSNALAAVRWILVMRSLDFPGSVRFYLAAYLKGMFFSQALPSNVGGDAYRVLAASGLGRGTKAAFYGVLIDRGVGLAALFLLIVLANLARTELFPAPVLRLLVAVSAAGAAGAIAFAWIGRWPPLARIRLLAPLVQIAAGLRAVAGAPAAFLGHTVFALVIHAVAMAAVALIGAGVGLEYDFGVYLAVAPPVFIVTLIPISLAGWGVRESGMVCLFTLIGADPARVLSMSMLYGVLLLLASLPGLALFLAGRRKEGAR